VAVGHEIGGEDGLTVADPWPIPRRSSAAGGVTSNAPELIRFAVMHLRNGAVGERRVISEKSARAMRTVQAKADYTHDRGLAWSVHQIGDLSVVEHGGATNGFMARLILIPDKNYAIVVLTNGELGSSLHNAVIEQAIEDRFGARNTLTRVELPASTLEPFTGVYRTSLADVTITVDGGQLTMARVAHNPFSSDSHDLGTFAMSPLSESVFVIDDGQFEGTIGELLFDDAGKIRFLRMGGRLYYPDR
jgi:hypothetical protein